MNESVNYFGTFEGNGGYQVLGRSILKALYMKDFDVKLCSSTQSQLRSIQHETHLSATKEFKDVSFCLSDNVNSLFFAGKKRILYTMYEGSMLPKHEATNLNSCDLVVVPAPFFLDVFKAGGVKEEKLRVLEGCVDTSVFRPSSFSRTFHRKDDYIVFTMVGKYETRKASFEALKGFLMCFENDPNVNKVMFRLKWSTDTKWRGFNQVKIDTRDLMRQYPKAAQRVTIIDQNNVDILELYNNSDCFVFPSRAEGIGLPLLEAMACGVPSITTQYTSLKDIGTEDSCILLPNHGQVPMVDEFYGIRPDNRGTFGDVKSMDIANAMRRFVNMSQEERQVMGRKAIERVHEKFTMKHFADNLAELIRDVHSL